MYGTNSFQNVTVTFYNVMLLRFLRYDLQHYFPKEGHEICETYTLPQNGKEDIGGSRKCNL